MALAYPYFLVNCKTYDGTTGEDGLAFARTIQRVVEDTGRRFAIAPQLPDIRLIADRTTLPVVAQAGTRREDATMGGVTLEAVAAAGADAVFVTHPENDAAFGDLPRLIDRCEHLGLESIVTVNGLDGARAALSFGPDCLLLERPDDIASEGGLVRADPDRVEAFVELVASERPETRTFVGGGIRTADDVGRAFSCGVDATGAASAAVDAPDREAWLRSIADAVPRSLE